jgi:hypothetical protein
VWFAMPQGCVTPPRSYRPWRDAAIRYRAEGEPAQVEPYQLTQPFCNCVYRIGLNQPYTEDTVNRGGQRIRNELPQLAGVVMNGFCPPEGVVNPATYALHLAWIARVKASRAAATAPQAAAFPVEGLLAEADEAYDAAMMDVEEAHLQQPQPQMPPLPAYVQHQPPPAVAVPRYLPPPLAHLAQRPQLAHQPYLLVRQLQQMPQQLPQLAHQPHLVVRPLQQMQQRPPPARQQQPLQRPPPARQQQPLQWPQPGRPQQGQPVRLPARPQLDFSTNGDYSSRSRSRSRSSYTTSSDSSRSRSRSRGRRGSRHRSRRYNRSPRRRVSSHRAQPDRRPLRQPPPVAAAGDYRQARGPPGSFPPHLVQAPAQRLPPAAIQPAPPTVAPPVAVPPSAAASQPLAVMLASAQATNTELLIGYSHLASIRVGLLQTLARTEALLRFSAVQLRQPMPEHVARDCVGAAKVKYNILVAPACNSSTHLMSALSLLPFDIESVESQMRMAPLGTG